MPNSQSPFLFKELRGTSWHRRFVAEEYRIFLDHYPDRMLISDSSLDNKADPDGKLMSRYENLIIDMFVGNGSIDEMTPGGILKALRGYRAQLYGNTDFACSGFTASKNLENLFSRAEKSASPCIRELRAALESAEEIIHFPSSGAAIESDSSYLSRYTSAEIEVRDPSRDLPLGATGIIELAGAQAEGKFILTANLWMYLEVFRTLSGFGLLLDNSEWFAHGLFQSSDPGSISGGVQKRPFPAGIDISGVQYCGLSLHDFLDGRKALSIRESFRNRILELDDEGFGFKLNTEFTGINMNTEEVLVSSAFIREEDCTCSPLLIGACTSPDQLNLSGQGLLTSFNYYFTDNLKTIYNNSSDTAGDSIPMSNFFIDYIFSADGKTPETLPLYNKAMLGCSRSGRVFAGYWQPYEIRISVGNVSLIFPEELINPAGTGNKKGIYLPSSGITKAGTGCQAAVLINNRIIRCGRGPFRIPPTGAVIADESLGGVSDGDFAEIEVDFGKLPFPRNDIQWLCGGFNLLIKDGKNLYQDTDAAKESLTSEGWYSRLSGLTQETQLLPGLRQPRIVFGRTESGILFTVSFSGRTRHSAGASFEECASYCESIIREAGDQVDFVINFDGGASASLTAFKDARYFNLSHTAPSETNPCGIQRPVPSYFMIKEKQSTGDILC